MGGIAAKNGMAALAFHSPSSVSLHAAPLGGSEMPERFKGSYVSASTLTAEANFVNQTQQWHVIGSGGVDVSWGLSSNRERDEVACLADHNPFLFFSFFPLVFRDLLMWCLILLIRVHNGDLGSAVKRR